MALAEPTAGDDIGFVSGIVDMPVSADERAAGRLGHTVDEWLAYNANAGGHPLKNNHGDVVGRLVHTYVDHQGRLCASALLNPEHRTLWEDVRQGRLHSFSIGFDATRERIGEQYKNKNFEVSLTDNPRKPFATIQVRCSNSAMSDAATPTPAPAAAAPVPVPAPAPVATPAPAAAIPEELLQQMSDMRKKAEQWEAHERAERERLFTEQRGRITAAEAALRETGMDVDNPGQQALLTELARTPHSAQLLMSLEKMAAERAEFQRQAAEARAQAEAEARARAEAEASASRNKSVYNQLREQFGVMAETGMPAAKRNITSDTWASTRPAEMPAAQSSLLNLDNLNAALFSSAARAMPAAAAAIMPPAASASSSSSAAPPAEQRQPIDMPRTPEDRLLLAWNLEKYNAGQMPVSVRCSAGDEPFANERIEKLLFNPHIKTHTQAMGGIGGLSPNMIELFMRDEAYWQGRARQVMASGSLPGSSIKLRPILNPHEHASYNARDDFTNSVVERAGPPIPVLMPVRQAL